jgi:TetR/AcrR family transcriptional repressor of lmrAB and yxaGH operons
MKVTDQELVERLLAAFREVGYDAISMSELAKIAGIQKASLYHRFPNGKLEMAKAVLDYIETESQRLIVDVLKNSSANLETRLKTAFKAIDMLYEGGRLNCILRALSIGSAAEYFREQIAGIFSGWIDGFTQIGLEVGKTPKEAKRMAQQVVIRIQGVLIVARTLQDLSLFEQVLVELEKEILS